MKPALIIGTTCVDIIINIPHLPVTEEDIHPTSQTMTLGGCAYNAAHIVRLLDVPCTHISPVGGGMYGDYVAKCLTEKGIPISVRIPDKENGCCYCLVEENGERTFMAYHGVEYTFQKEWMKPYQADAFSLVYICGLEIEEATGIQLIEYLEENPKLPIFFAPGPRLKQIERNKLKRILALHPILHINEQESYFLNEVIHSDDFFYSANPIMESQAEDSEIPPVVDAARKLHAVTENSVIITLGKRGTFCIEANGSEYLIPSVPAEHIVDTIGAGDSHAGTIIAALTKGMTLYDSIAYANKIAAAVVEVQGINLTRDKLKELHLV